MLLVPGLLTMCMILDVLLLQVCNSFALVVHVKSVCCDAHRQAGVAAHVHGVSTWTRQFPELMPET